MIHRIGARRRTLRYALACVAALGLQYGSAAAQSAAFLADAQKQNLQIAPRSAEEVEALVARASTTPLAIRQKAAAILEWK